MQSERLNNNLFKSDRERRLWIVVFIAVTVIYSTAGLALKIARYLEDHDLQAVFFVLGMVLVGATIVTQGLKVRPGGTEILVLLGLFAVFFMAGTRITLLEERSHLIEYSVVALFIFEALKERKSKGSDFQFPGLIAIIATSLIGIMDEGIQAITPKRVFDPQDIFFNASAAVFAVIASMILSWIRKKYLKPKQDIAVGKK